MQGTLMIDYDFDTTATVEFADSKQVSVADVVAYFEDASDGKVELIRIFTAS
jgi:hypothetical protein